MSIFSNYIDRSIYVSDFSIPVSSYGVLRVTGNIRFVYRHGTTRKLPLISLRNRIKSQGVIGDIEFFHFRETVGYECNALSLCMS